MIKWKKKSGKIFYSVITLKRIKRRKKDEEEKEEEQEKRTNEH